MKAILPQLASKRSSVLKFAVLACCAAATTAVPWASTAVESVVTTTAPSGPFNRNSHDEPAMAVDASRPNVLAISAHEYMDQQPCSKAASIATGRCTFLVNGLSSNLGVGLTGIYLSFDSGHTWTQPTYQGLTAAGCDPEVEPCVAKVGPIHTVPNYYERGLRTIGDPAVAFGPIPDQNGHFSWSNGSRLYAGTIVTDLTNASMRDEEESVNNVTNVAASFIDNVTPQRIQNQANWSTPQFVDPHVATAAFQHKPALWADNAASSPYFGNVYVCYSDQHSLGQGHAFTLFANVARSTDGGVSWSARSVLSPIGNFEQGGHFSCAVRTDSHGVVYVFFNRFAFGFPGHGSHTMVKSLDGGRTWTPPREIVDQNDACYVADFLAPFSCVMDGYLGVRIDVTAAPSVDIANGAPTGENATNELVDVWGDGRFGFNHEAAVLSYSTDGGDTWSNPTAVSLPGDRALFAAAAIAPDGSHLYVVYMGFTAPFQFTTANPRPVRGVFLSSPIGPNGAPSGWTTVHEAPAGDARASGGVGFGREFLGDYVYAIATRTYGAGTWTDARSSVDCPAVDQWRQQSLDAGIRVIPAPWPLAVCPNDFGNIKIYSVTTQ